MIADAVEAAHEKGILHRDLKPANVKIKLHAMVKVLDFGLAKSRRGVHTFRKTGESADPDTGGSQAGVVLGTAAYMAPEQARGHLVLRRGVVRDANRTAAVPWLGVDRGQSRPSVPGRMSHPPLLVPLSRLRRALRSRHCNSVGQ